MNFQIFQIHSLHIVALYRAYISTIYVNKYVKGFEIETRLGETASLFQRTQLQTDGELPVTKISRMPLAD